MNPSLRIKTFCVSVAALALVSSASVSLAEPWSFGVMADTQWKSNLDGENPNSVAVGIINQLNTQFIGAGVKFVVQVGDITDNGNNPALDTRAVAAQALYDAGIGYYPLRGNHESSQAAATYFQTKFQQTQGQGSYVFGASNFSSPFLQLNGLSYSFDYGGNARLVLLDQFTRTDGTNNTGRTDNNIIDQQDWIGASLAGKPADSHAFVFAHKGLITENHTDILFAPTQVRIPPPRTLLSPAFLITACVTSWVGTITCTIGRSSRVPMVYRRCRTSSAPPTATSSTFR